MDDNSLSRKIGELSGHIDGLHRAFTTLVEHREAAHRDIVARLNKIDEKLVCLALVKDHVESHSDRIKTVELIAQDYTERKNRLLGGAGILAFVGAGAAWLINRLWP